jgi:carbon monoxide dehydrogenase subunit G
MEFDNTLEVPLPPAEAWVVLLDIKRIATCIPGAELTEVVDERTYKGKVAVRIGPVALSLVGQARLEDIDEANHRARVKAQGSDPKGRGSTDSVIEFRLEPAGAGSRVLIHSDVKLAGSIAQYGRGAGMIQSVAAQLIGQFGEALKAQIAQAGSGADPGAAKPISGLTVLGKAAWDSITRAPEKPSIPISK